MLKVVTYLSCSSVVTLYSFNLPLSLLDTFRLSIYRLINYCLDLVENNGISSRFYVIECSWLQQRSMKICHSHDPPPCKLLTISDTEQCQFTLRQCTCVLLLLLYQHVPMHATVLIVLSMFTTLGKVPPGKTLSQMATLMTWERTRIRQKQHKNNYPNDQGWPLSGSIEGGLQD